MNKTELVETVASKTEISKAEAGRIVNAVFDAINKGLESDGKVVLPGFGTFGVRSRDARTGYNPKTGEKIKIKAASFPFFKPGKGMRNNVARKR